MSSYIDKLKQALEEAKNPMITCPNATARASTKYLFGERDMKTADTKRINVNSATEQAR
jgi:protein tyrosine phosphatase (PTP) superfamily phosphohydrolase (DUF442 family)